MTVWGGGVKAAERDGEGEGEESLTAMHTSGKGSKRGSVDSFPDQVQNQRRDPNIPETGDKGEQYRPVQTAERSAKEEERTTTSEAGKVEGWVDQRGGDGGLVSVRRTQRRRVKRLDKERY